jgi:Protein of unknown function (DUF2844)
MVARSTVPILCILLIGCCLLTPVTADASLGGDRSSVLDDATAVHGVVQSAAGPGFEVLEIATEGGLQLREFITREGAVFAIAWSGPVMPDLQQLLGGRFADYAAALRAQDHPGRRRVVRLANTALVVESAGHLRAYTGRAYLPAMLPAGVAPAQLR